MIDLFPLGHNARVPEIKPRTFVATLGHMLNENDAVWYTRLAYQKARVGNRLRPHEKEERLQCVLIYKWAMQVAFLIRQQYTATKEHSHE